MVCELAGTLSQSKIQALFFTFFFFTVVTTGLPLIVIKVLRFPHHILERFIYRSAETFSFIAISNERTNLI